MASTSSLFFFALLCTASCSPLGETTICESASNVLPSIGLGVGPLGLNLPSSLLLQLLSQTLAPSLGSTTVIDSKPNIGLPVISPYGLPVNTGSTTVCDSVSNIGLPVLQNIGLPVPGQTTVCENAPNVTPFSLPYPYGLNLPALSNLGGSTTVVESSPTPITPLGLPLGMNLPYLRQLGGLGLGLPLNGLGLPLNGLGLPLNGLGLPLGGLGGIPLSPFGLPLPIL